LASRANQTQVRAGRLKIESRPSPCWGSGRSQARLVAADTPRPDNGCTFHDIGPNPDKPDDPSHYYSREIHELDARNYPRIVEQVDY